MGSAPRPPPLVIDAFLNAGLTTCTLLFDQPLTSVAALNLGNWTVAWLADAYDATAAVALGRRVVLTLQLAVGEPPADGVTYAPPPFDVQSRWAVPLAAFADYPLRIGP